LAIGGQAVPFLADLAQAEEGRQGELGVDHGEVNEALQLAPERGIQVVAVANAG